MVRKARLVGVTPQKKIFFSIFAYFLGVTKNCLYFYVVNGLASSLFLIYKP